MISHEFRYVYRTKKTNIKEFNNVNTFKPDFFSGGLAEVFG